MGREMNNGKEKEKECGDRTDERFGYGSVATRFTTSEFSVSLIVTLVLMYMG